MLGTHIFHGRFKTATAAIHLLQIQEFAETGVKLLARSAGISKQTVDPMTFYDRIASLQQRDLLEKNKEGLLTMPGSGQLRLPIVPRSLQEYRKLLVKTGYSWQEIAVYATDEVINVKPGLRHMLHKPVALILECRKQ
jgi:hypothetical protein